MRNFSRAISLLVVFLFLFTGLAQETQPVKLDQLPLPAQKTIQAECGPGKGKLGEIEKSVEGGEISYDVTLNLPKRERSFGVAPDGRLLYWQMFVNELPEAVRNSLTHQVQSAHGKLEEVNRVVADGVTTYEVSMSKEARNVSFSLSSEGKLLTMQIILAEAPTAVQHAIQARTAQATLLNIEKNSEDEDMVYDVEIMKGGRKIPFSLSPEGKLLTMGITLDEAPGPVQRAIRERAAQSVIISIEKNTEDDDVTYDVETREAGKKVYFSVDADGKLVTD